MSRAGLEPATTCLNQFAVLRMRQGLYQLSYRLKTLGWLYFLRNTPENREMHSSAQHVRYLLFKELQQKTLRAAFARRVGPCPTDSGESWIGFISPIQDIPLFCPFVIHQCCLVAVVCMAACLAFWVIFVFLKITGFPVLIPLYHGFVRCQVAFSTFFNFFHTSL